jgi:hypothetical protein
MKYIVINSESGLPAAILFNEVLNHKAVASGYKVLGAGFCNATGAVWGYSESLGVESRPKDSTHVKLALSFTLNPEP